MQSALLCLMLAVGPLPLIDARPTLVALSVANLDVARQWYIDILGFHDSRRAPYASPTLRIAFLELNGFELELIEARGSVGHEAIRKAFPHVVDRAKIRGFGKLAFQTRDVRETASHLKRQKVRIVRDAAAETDPARRTLIIEDCDGNWIQFVQAGRP